MATKNGSLTGLRNGLIAILVIPAVIFAGLLAMDPEGALDYFDKHEQTKVTILVKKQMGRNTGPVSVSWTVFGSPPASGSEYLRKQTLRKTYMMNVASGVSVIIKIPGRTWTSCSISVNGNKGKGHPLSWENPGMHECVWP